jgi:hypothetical protein
MGGTILDNYVNLGILASMKNPVNLLILLLLTLLPACGQRDPELGAVQGTVTLDGQPLAGAIVIFEPKAGGHTSRAITDASGRYQLVYLRDANGALVGSHIVRIFTATEDVSKERLPAQYNKKSILTVDVVGGTNKFNFELTSRNK